MTNHAQALPDTEQALQQLRTQQFLDELTLLSRRYGIVIHGCGCCHSPSLEKTSIPPPDPRQRWRWDGKHADGHYIRKEQGAELEWVGPHKSDD